MVKLVFCLRRLPGLSREEFQEYWLEKHGPLVRRHAAALRIQRYVQAHTRGGPITDALRGSRDAPEEFDGVAELWWQSETELRLALETEEGRIAGMALLEDERTFIDLARSPLWLAEERTVLQR